MITILAATLALVAQDRPYQQSAQCLIEIAALTGETLDMTQPETFGPVITKADRLYEVRQRIIAARANVVATRPPFLRVMREDEAAGRVPPGTADAMVAQWASEDRVRDNSDRVAALETPSCRWPTAG